MCSERSRTQMASSRSHQTDSARNGSLLPVRFILCPGRVERIGHGPTETTLDQKDEQAERTSDEGQEQGQARRPLLSQTRTIDPDPNKEIKGQIMRPASSPALDVKRRRGPCSYEP